MGFILLQLIVITIMAGFLKAWPSSYDHHGEKINTYQKIMILLGIVHAD